ncbi:hypothetical protein K435DRAFT_701052, partial [Dendrothele bispora CBS 962.96]
IKDINGKIFAALVGNPPDDPTWQSVHTEAALLLEKHRHSVVLPHEDISRRGVRKYISTGYSFGGGQKLPMPLNQHPRNQQIIDDLLASECFQRISGHVSSAFSTWAPKLHQQYVNMLSKYQAEDPLFSKNFSKSAFAAATFNFDEQTETMEHVDYFNYIVGWCGITSLGRFNHTKGGHVILWDLRIVIEFPAGTSMIIPSCYLRHSNTSIAPGETRQSFTEYSASGLFRYMDDGMKTRVSMSIDEREMKKRDAWEKAREAIRIYSTFNELVDSLMF